MRWVVLLGAVALLSGCGVVDWCTEQTNPAFGGAGRGVPTPNVSPTRF